MTRLFQRLCLIGAVVLLAACAGKPVKEPAAQLAADTARQRLMAEQALRDRIADAFDALASGDHVHAATLFRRLSDDAQPPQKQEFLYFAAESLFRAGLAQQASQYLSELDVDAATAQVQFKVQLLQAEMALRRHPEQVLEILSEAVVPVSELADNRALFARFHQLRGQAYSRTGNHLGAAYEYVLREKFLQADSEAIADNQLVLWQALGKVAINEIDPKNPFLASPIFRGWTELMALARDFHLSGDELDKRIARWHQRYPNHPAMASFITDRIRASRALILHPHKIALLFGFSGRFGQAATAVRDGIFAAYLASSEKGEVELVLYDIGADPANTVATYQRAVAEGADLVIGPLDKDAVRELAREPELEVPTLALNFAESALNPNLFQFALSPEREARQVAERAWLEGYQQAAVVVPDGPLGERMHHAFVERWQELGGNVASSTVYPSKQNDYSYQLKRLLNIDLSEDRHHAVDRIIGARTEYIPRRREDIDFVFLVAQPRQARLMQPQFRFFHAGDLPIFSTSSAFSGEIDRNKDRDMEGIAFLDIPWTLGVVTQTVAVRQHNKEALAGHGGALQRLVAMGVDAYSAAPFLRFLEQFPYETYDGETGRLSVLQDRQIRNKMLWARFRSGRPRLMEELSAGDEGDTELY